MSTEVCLKRGPSIPMGVTSSFGDQNTTSGSSKERLTFAELQPAWVQDVLEDFLKCETLENKIDFLKGLSEMWKKWLFVGDRTQQFLNLAGISQEGEETYAARCRLEKALHPKAMVAFMETVSKIEKNRVDILWYLAKKANMQLPQKEWVTVDPSLFSENELQEEINARAYLSPSSKSLHTLLAPIIQKLPADVTYRKLFNALNFVPLSKHAIRFY
jgi:hypothetical protein